MKALIFVLPVVVIAAVLGLAFTGKINIPGITPKKPAATAMYASDQSDKPVADKAKTPTPPSKPKPNQTASTSKRPAKAPANGPSKDIEQGADALATVWNEIDTPELISISKDWKDPDLVRVLAHMDNDKVAAFIDQLAKGNDASKVKPDPERASKLSKALQAQGSIVAPVGGANKTT